MKNAYLIFGLLILFHGTGRSQSNVPAEALGKITAEGVEKHIGFLASDAMLGRKTPSAGLDTAAAYIASELRKYGILPVNGSYLHAVPLIRTTLGDDNFLEINNKGKTQQLEIKSQFIPFEHTANGNAEGSLVFAGYGITAPEYNYDDYEGLEAKGRIVLVMQHEPGEQDASSVFEGRTPTRYSSVDYKMENAIEHGAVGMLVITGPLNHLIIKPTGYPWPSLSPIIPENALPITLKERDRRSIPMVHVGEEIMLALFESVDSLERLQAEIDEKMVPLPKEFPDVLIRMKTHTIEKQIMAGNVMGMLPGRDRNLREEYLVIGAHYDHLGFLSGQTAAEDSVYNGADDNASGTAGVLLLAEAFSSLSKAPRRSVLFIAFAGEELGLYGSRAYVEDPAVDLDHTVAMMNMDMISRNHRDSLRVRGASHSPELAGIVVNENKEIGLQLDLEDRNGLGGSDHLSFYEKGIPMLGFHTGLHNDYHTVRDNPESVDAEKAARIIRLVFRTALNIANDSKRYTLIHDE